MTYFDPLLAEEVGGGVQHVGRVAGVVVGVGGVVVGLDHLEPGAQGGLRAAEELAHPKAGEDLQAQVGEGPGGGRGEGREEEGKGGGRETVG